MIISLLKKIYNKYYKILIKFNIVKSDLDRVCVCGKSLGVCKAHHILRIISECLLGVADKA